VKVTVLDDYQHAFDSTDAIQRLREKAEVRILTEKLPSDAAVAQALRGSQAIIPVRERTKFTASLFEQLPDLEYISQTGNHAYHVDMEAATRRGVVPDPARHSSLLKKCSKPLT
jgi:D-3-phosphoglycerate dehydrogenase